MGSGDLLMKKVVKPSSFDLDMQFDQSWMEDVTCPICLDFPHNAVLLRCTSYEKGCRPFICDTDHTRSNCLDRFKGAHGLPANVKISSLTVAPLDSIHIISSNANNRPACPLCRGDVIGWFVIDAARLHLNQKKRCCEESCCSYVGNFHELQKHTQQKHPNSRPSEIDPARRVDWENLEQSSDIIDVLSTIHAQVPNGIVLGDYVIEYGDDEAGDDYEVFHRVRRNWWASCLFCKAFCRSSGGRRRARTNERSGSGRRRSNRSSHESFTLEVPTRSVEIRELRFDEIDDEYIVTGAMPRVAASRRMASHYRFLCLHYWSLLSVVCWQLYSWNDKHMQTLRPRLAWLHNASAPRISNSWSSYLGNPDLDTDVRTPRINWQEKKGKPHWYWMQQQSESFYLFFLKESLALEFLVQIR